MKFQQPSVSAPPSRFAIRLGYVPLVDSAPLLMAQELGLFKKYGIPVVLQREPGWSSIRDKLSFGELHGAHAPIGLSFALTLGQQCLPTRMLAPLMISTHGNAITLSNNIPPETIREEQGLAQYFSSLQNSERKPTFAAAHPWSSHSVMLHSWLARHGLLPQKNVDILFLPPPVMARNLRAGTIDGFCVGEPWNSKSILEGDGWCAARSSSMAAGEAEKAFIVVEDFCKNQPDVVTKLLAALLESCRYCSDRSNTAKVVEVLSRPEHLDCDPEFLKNSLGSTFNTGVKTVDSSLTSPFISDDQTQPQKHSANWLITGLRMIGMLEEKDKVDVSHIFNHSFFDRASEMIKEAEMKSLAS